MFKGKDPLSGRALLCIALCFLPHFSKAVSCQQVFARQASEFMGFDEFLEVGATTMRVYEEVAKGRRIEGLYDAFLTSPKYEEVPALAIREAQMRRFDFRPPESQGKIELQPSLKGVRDRALGVLPTKVIELPFVQIQRISAKPLEGSENYQIAELNSGQVVFVSKPLQVTHKEGQITIHYHEKDLILHELHRVGLIPFLAVGQDASGAFRLVRPPFLAHYGELYTDFNAEFIFDSVETQILPRLAQIDLPWFKQHFNPDVARSVAFHVLENFVLGDINHKSDLGIIGLVEGGLRPWRIETESGGILAIAPQPRSADHFIGVLDIVRASIISHLPAETKMSLVKKAYRDGDLDQVFMAIYLDLLLGKFRPTDWKSSEFQARVNQDASIKVQDWVSGRSLKYHFKKHGRDEMGLQTPEEYVQMAREFFTDSEASAILLKRLGTEGFFKYNFETREFGVLDTDLRIITYFQLDTAHQNGIDFHRYLAEQIGR